MYLRLSFPALLLCLVFLMCGGGNAARDLQENYFFSGLHKTPQENYFFPGLHKTPQENYFFPGLHKTPQENYFFPGLHKTPQENYFFPGLHKTSQESSKMMYDHAEYGLFSIDEVRGFIAGKKLPIFFPVNNHSLYPQFLPKEFAETIPFSSSQVSEIMQFFSISPDSPKGKAVQDTLQKCELEAVQGETKICATSLESFHGFLSNTFGPEVHYKFITTTHPTITTSILQNYTVLESPQEIQSPKKVSCHPMPYLYAVYYCHFEATETKAFKLQLVGDITGDNVDALLLCHMDTSGWSSEHHAFRIIGIKQGNPVCHVFSQGNLVWIESSDIAVGAM